MLKQAGSNYVTLAKQVELNRLLGKKVKFIIRYDTTKLSKFCSIKDPVPTLHGSSVVCKLSCPGCSQQYYY